MTQFVSEDMDSGFTAKENVVPVKVLRKSCIRYFNPVGWKEGERERAYLAQSTSQRLFAANDNDFVGWWFGLGSFGDAVIGNGRIRDVLDVLCVSRI